MMPFRLGIGIITYNRKELVASTVNRVRALTREPDAALVVADDGSEDGTLELLREMHAPAVTGAHMGIAWNKNRALFLLSSLLGCESIILLEDDTQPNSAGWETQWLLAAQRWGHVNYAGEWMREYFVSGTGTAEDPTLSTMVTAQCAAYSRTALTYAGYLDPRFKGYGHEHVEHTRRLIRVGYGGCDGLHGGQQRILFRMVDSGLAVITTKSHFRPDESERNLLLARQIIGDEAYRVPWSNDQELHQFRGEMDCAMDGGSRRFRLHSDQSEAIASDPPRRSLLRRLRYFSRGRGEN